MKQVGKFRKLLVDDSEGIYTVNIQYHCWYGWITIKIIEHPDLSYIMLKADEILATLNEKI